MKKTIGRHTKKMINMFKFWRSGKSNLNMFLTFMSLIMIWRGIWHLLDHYLLPNHYVLNAIIPMLLGLAFLFFDDASLKELTK